MKKAFLLLLAGVLAGAVLYGQSFGAIDDVEEAMVRSDMALMAFNNLIPMRFGSALDGKAIANAQVNIEGVGSFVTDNRGIISFPVKPDGSYRMVVGKEGFITTAIDFQIQLSTVVLNWYSISPVLQGDFRFVLEWGESPSDLDIHLEKEGGYHISYRHTRDASDGSAKLDRDDTNSYGPETITIARLDNTGRYRVYVVDYTNSRNNSSNALSRSGARIRVYGDNRLLGTFNVPNGQGARWNVLDINRGGLADVNTITANR